MPVGQHARPFLLFHVGQAGVQIGHAIWELLCLEHNITPDGLAKPECPSNGFYDAMFLKSSSGHFMPRAIFVDTDPICVDEVRNGHYRELFASNQLISDQDDAGFNYMRGRHDFLNRLVPDSVERFRWLMEKTDVTPAAFLVHGIGGGTGSGVAAACMETLKGELGNSLEVMELNVTSGRTGLQNSCELVNSTLYQYETRDYSRVSFTVSNSAIYNVCRSSLGNANATYAHVNRMLAMCFSNLTAMERFPATVPCSVTSMCTNVLPFRQLKHPVLACAPFSTVEMASKERLTTVGVTSAVLELDGQLSDIDLRQGKHMAGVLLYRGPTKSSDIEQALATLKAKNRMEFVEWAPAGFKTGLIELPPLSVPSSGIGSTALSVTLVSNHTAVAALFRGQSDSIKKLSSTGTFLHNYDSVVGSPVAGNNSGIKDLLHEACDYMDQVVSVYESEAPPTQEPTPPKQQFVRKQVDKSRTHAAVRRSSSDGKDHVTEIKQKRILAIEALVAVLPADHQTTESKASKGASEGEAGEYKTEAPQAYGAITTDSMQTEGGEAQFESTESSGKVHKFQNQDATKYERDRLVESVHTDEHEGSVTLTSTEDSAPIPAPAYHVQQSTLTSAEGPHPSSGTPDQAADDRGRRDMRGGEEGGSCCKKRSDRRKGRKDAVKKDEAGRGPNGAVNEGTEDGEQQVGGGAGSRGGGGGCCKKRSSDSGTGKKRSRSARADRQQHSFQSQNHAYSGPRASVETATAADTDSCRSANCVDSDYHRNRRSVSSNGRAAWSRQIDADSSSASAPMDGTLDIRDIIHHTMPASVTTSSTINSVRQIIQKYNEIFAKESD